MSISRIVTSYLFPSSRIPVSCSFNWSSSTTILFSSSTAILNRFIKHLEQEILNRKHNKLIFRLLLKFNLLNKIAFFSKKPSACALPWVLALRTSAPGIMSGPEQRTSLLQKAIVLKNYFLYFRRTSSEVSFWPDLRDLKFV